MSVQHKDLWQRWRQSQDTAARDELTRSYLWLVRYIAGRLMVGLPSHVDQSDMEGHGCFGLLEAMNRYDPERGVRFETFAIPWIRGACFEGLRAMQWAPALRKRARQFEKAQEELLTALGREPSREELAQHMGLTPEEIDKRMEEVGTLTILSLDETFTYQDEGDSSSLAERVSDKNAPDPVAESEFAEKRDLLAKAIESLSEKERLVISLFYYEGLLAREISEVLGLSQARVSQIHSQAILRLRGKLSRLKKDLVS
ncbi:MAG: FliA/WhiG family RNA polymerase sigma factor [Bacillota bacterium]